MALGIVYSNGTSATVVATPWDVTTWTIPTCTKLVVIIGIGDSTDRVPASVTWNSVGMTQVTSGDNANYVGVAAYYLDSPSIGNYTLRVNLDDPAQAIAACIIALGDAETGDPAFNGGSGTGTGPTVTVAGSANGDLLIGGMMTDAQNTTNETDTLVYESLNLDGDVDFSVQYATATGANAVSDWTTGSDGWAAVAVSVGGTGAATYAPSNTVRPRILTPFATARTRF